VSHNPDITFCTSRLEDWGSFVELGPAWDKLVARIPSASIFQTYQWHSCWWRAFGDAHRLFVITCHKGQQLVGIAPMMISRGKSPAMLRRTEIRFIGCTNNASDYLDFIIDPDVPEALDVILNELFGHLAAVDRIHLSHFRSHLENHSRVRNFLQAYKARFVIEPEQRAPYRSLGNTDEDRRITNKSSLRRSYNYFDKSGDLRFHKCKDESEILAYLDEFFDQHVARRDLTAWPSQFLDPAQRSFYRDLVGELLPRDWLRFDLVLYNGRPLSFHFGFEYRNSFIWYKPTFDIRYFKRSPGEVLIKYLLEDAIEKDLDEFDFTVGSEAFKYRFSNNERLNDRFIVFRSFIAYWIYRSILAARKMARKMVGLGARFRKV